MKHTFTLVELLVSIAIIAILAGILLPTVNGAIKKAQSAKAKAEMTTLVNAIKQYESQYGVLPITVSSLTNQMREERKDLSDQEANKYYEEFILMLQGEKNPDSSKRTGSDPMGWGNYKELNKRKIKFLDVVNNTPGDFIDPWDNNYIICFDYTGNGQIFRHKSSCDNDEFHSGDDTPTINAIPTAPIYGSIVIYSLGPDGKDWDDSSNSKKDQGKDNVFSIPVLWDKKDKQFEITH